MPHDKKQKIIVLRHSFESLIEAIEKKEREGYIESDIPIATDWRTSNPRFSITMVLK